MTRVAAVVLACFLTSLATGCNESWEKNYPDVASANADGMTEKGWLPASIPHDATNLIINGDLDSNIALGSFTSMDTMAVRCTAVPDSTAIPDYASSWLGLRHITTSATLKIKGFDVFQCGSDEFTFAYKRFSKHYFYWYKVPN